jgi:predicted Holliday junction resolvase-like endonuclease
MHDVVVVGIPLLAILAGILFSRSDIKELRSEMRSEMKELRSAIRGEIQDLRSEMRTRFDLVDAELRYFHGTVGKLEARVDAIEKRS